jgi:hypothetical protein
MKWSLTNPIYFILIKDRKSEFQITITTMSINHNDTNLARYSLEKWLVLEKTLERIPLINHETK